MREIEVTQLDTETMEEQDSLDSLLERDEDIEATIETEKEG